MHTISPKLLHGVSAVGCLLPTVALVSRPSLTRINHLRQSRGLFGTFVRDLLGSHNLWSHGNP